MANLTSSEPADKPREFRKRFVLIDPRAVDKQLLYFDSSEKPSVGLILETERDQSGKFPVRQAAPGRMTKVGVRGKVIGWWKFVHPKWDSKDGKAARTKAAVPKP